MLTACQEPSTKTAKSAKTVEAPKADAPNVILIIADAMRADRSSVYSPRQPVEAGQPARPTSPNLEALARDGVVFEQAFSQAPWTPPSMASLMTGLYQTSHRVTQSLRSEGRHSVLDSRFETLAELFGSVGYRTGAVSAQPWVSEETGFGQGFESFELVTGNRDPYSNDKVMVGGLEWLDRHRDEKFFLYLHMMDPHFPYEVPELFRSGIGEAPDRFRGGITLEALESLNLPAAPPTKAERDYLLAFYDSEIRYVDWWVGVLDRHLRHRGLREKTLIIFTSDHGEAFYEHGVWGHITTVFNEMLHVPLILSQPGLVARREPRPVESVDLLPTLANLVGFRAPDGLPGHDLLGDDLPGLAYSEGERLLSFKLQSQDLSVIIVPETKSWVVYDLAADPGERTNVAEQKSAQAKDLLRQLMVRRQRAGQLVLPGAEQETSLDDETRHELEALGYAR